MAQSTPIPPDLETLWAALDSFFRRFAVEDWSRKHGLHWTFASVPYHLAYFNRLVIDGLDCAKTTELAPKTTLHELDTWNDAQFAARPADLTGPAALEYLHATQRAIRDVAARTSADAAVFLPLLMVGGWRTFSFALEYLLNHTWFHFTESHLRYHKQLPALPADVVHRCLDFGMHVVAEAIPPERRAGVDVVVTVQLTGDGGGSWTFTLQDGEGRVRAGPVEQPDASISSDIATYLKTSVYGMQHPLIALLTGKTHIRGFSKVRQFQRLVAPTPTQAWQPIERGRDTPA
jgi:hypothetical protein